MTPKYSVSFIIISIHALREEGDHERTCRHKCHQHISIHALREEGDLPLATWLTLSTYFYPRPPRGGRLVSQPFGQTLEDFYPRPPRGGRPRESSSNSRVFFVYFYPRPPRGGRPRPSAGKCLIDQFLSTPSARRATAHQFLCDFWYNISIHALREEGDLARPTKPWRNDTISIHALREEGDSRPRSRC